MIGADKALQMGLVNQVVPTEKLLEAAITLAERLMKTLPFNQKCHQSLNAADGTQKDFRKKNFNFPAVLEQPILRKARCFSRKKKTAILNLCTPREIRRSNSRKVHRLLFPA